MTKEEWDKYQEELYGGGQYDQWVGSDEYQGFIE